MNNPSYADRTFSTQRPGMLYKAPRRLSLYKIANDLPNACRFQYNCLPPEAREKRKYEVAQVDDKQQMVQETIVLPEVLEEEEEMV